MPFDLPPEPPKFWLPPKPAIIRPAKDIVRPEFGFVPGCAASKSTRRWTPALLSPAGWFDAHLSAKTYSSGVIVSQWDDLSGNGRHATEGTAANQPTYDSTNGWLDFDGSNDRLSPSSNLLATGNSAFTVGICYRADVNGNGPPFSQGTNSSNQWTGLGSYIAGAVDFNVWGSDVGGGSRTVNIDYVHIWQYTGTQRLIYTNGGTTPTFTNSYSSLNMSASGPSIGRDALNGRYFNGKIRTLVAVRSSLGLADRQKLEGYLGRRWGVTLASGHPYEFAPPFV